MQQGHQLVVDVGAAGVGPGQHAADEGRPGQQPKQGNNQPTLAHQLFHQGAAGPLPARQLGGPLVVEGSLGAVNQDHLGRGDAGGQQLPGGGEGHHGADRVADKMDPGRRLLLRPQQPLAHQVGHQLAPEVEAVVNRTGLFGLTR